MSERVLATELARTTASRMSEVLGGMSGQIRNVKRLGTVLSDADSWDGPTARGFRSHWRDASATLDQAAAQVERMQQSSRAIVDAILRAGGTGAVSPAPPAPALGRSVGPGGAASPLFQRAAQGDRTALQQLVAMDSTGSNPALATQVNAWWTGLPPDTRAELIAKDPALVGALNGVPAADRSTANQEVLASDAAQLRQNEAHLLQQIQARTAWDRTHPGNPRFPEPDSYLGQLQGQLGDVQAKLQGIGAIHAQLATGSGTDAQRYLLGFDTNGNGHAIVSVGNPDTATNVVTYVPGLGTKLSGSAGDIHRAVTLWQQAGGDAPGQRVASVYWLGYNAPQGLDVSTEGAAGDGSHALAAFAEGLRASHQAGVPGHFTLLGHSYGSLVVGKALTLTHGSIADDVIFVGSPGVGVDHARDLGLDPSHVWAARANLDPVPDLPPWDPLKWFDGHSSHFGNDPTSPEFGGQTFGAKDLPAQDPLLPFSLHDHSSYWDEPALDNMARIVDGEYGQVVRESYPG